MAMKQPDFQNAGILFKTLTRTYAFTEYDDVGKSLLGRDVPLLRVGNGDKTVLLVGGADAGDRLSEELLLRFADDLCSQIQRQNTAYGLNCALATELRRILILPCLNPDGKALTEEGADPSSPLYERQLRQNGMKSDFSAWKGNARGVRLDLNFNEDFAARRGALMADGTCLAPITGEFPESEPETAFLTRLVHILEPVCVLECGSAPKERICTNRPVAVKDAFPGCDLPIVERFVYGLPSWFARHYDRPAIHLAVSQSPDSINRLYGRLREFFFRCLYTVAI